MFEVPFHVKALVGDSDGASSGAAQQSDDGTGIVDKEMHTDGGANVLRHDAARRRRALHEETHLIGAHRGSSLCRSIDTVTH